MARTNTRDRVLTLNGEMQVTETTYTCRQEDCRWDIRPSVLDHLLVPHRQIGIDVLFAIGWLRFVLHLQRDEVQAVLASRGVDIGTGSISRLGDEFLVRFRTWFEDQQRGITQVMSEELAPGEATGTGEADAEPARGYTLVIDGTMEDGGEVTFRARCASRGLTLHADVLESESEAEVVRFLEHVREVYPKPGLVVRDLGTAVTNAVTEVFPGVPQQACHVHFLRAVGKQLLVDPYRALRRAILATKQPVQLRRFGRAIDVPLEGLLTNTVEDSEVVETAFRLWARLLTEHIEQARTPARGLPFRLAYLEYVERAREGLAHTRRLLDQARGRYLVVPALLTLEERLEALLEDRDVIRTTRRVRLLNGWFEEVRSAMRLERWALSGRVDELAAADVDEEADEVSVPSVAEIQRTVDAMRTEARKAGLEEEWCRAVVDRFDRHGETLWTCLDENGDIVEDVEEVVRVTNGIERDHRDVRAGVRRRTGRKTTRNELERVGEHLAVLGNLWCPWFVEHVLDGVDLRAAFLGLDEEEIQERLGTLRQKRFGESLPVAACERENRLAELVRVAAGDDVEEIAEWTENVVA